jgi:ribonuclease III
MDSYWLFFFAKRKLFSDLELKVKFKNTIRILKSKLGISFRNQKYLLKALTHSSFVELHPELGSSNERLEFLGDSVLNMVTANYLFDKYPDLEEGFLTKRRSMLVNRERLYTVAEEIGFDECLLFNQKYIKDSLEGMQTILADGIEALIGALYLDQGLTASQRFVIKYIIHPFEEDGKLLIDKNYKGQLLELTHAQKFLPPRYVLINETGPAHKKEFTIDVYVGDEFLGTGLGRSKKTAEQEASRIAIEKLNKKLSENFAG